MDTPVHAAYAETTDAGYACAEGKHAQTADAWVVGISGCSTRAACCARRDDTACWTCSGTPTGSAEPRIARWMVWVFASLQ